MKPIEEVSEFTQEVSLLEETDRVKGGEQGPSNAQAKSLANRTRYLKDQQDALKIKVDNLSPATIGAEEAGAVDHHVEQLDPHNQYVLKSTANKPNGYLQLDGTGKLPADVIQTLASRYITVADEAERLALSAAPDLTICTQIDESVLYYLNATLDPSDPENWKKGQSSVVSGVSSFNGRTGNVDPENGDYTADQIVETETREFVTPAQKQSWANKQDKLVSGTTIKTFKGISLLGNGDFNPTPDELGCAAKAHTHVAANITDFDKAVVTRMASALLPGAGITIAYDNQLDQIKISATNGGVSGGVKLNVDTKLGSVANQIHSIKIGGITDFNLLATALKKDTALVNQVKQLADFSLANKANWSTTPAVTFTGVLNLYRGDTKLLVKNAEFYKADILTDGTVSLANSPNTSIVPFMTSNTQPTGYTASASGTSGANFPAWRAFDGQYVVSDGNDCWAGPWAGMSDSNPIWLQIDLLESERISGYSIQNRGISDNAPKSWKIQGSNDNGATWDTVHTIVDEPNFTLGEIRTYTLSVTSTAYKTYRIAITKVQSTDRNWCGIANFKLFYPVDKFLLRKGSNWFTVSAGALSQVTQTVTPAYIQSNGLSSVTDLVLTNGTMEVVSGVKLPVKVTYKPDAQIVLPVSVIDARNWETINSATMSTSEIGNGKVRVAITTDMQTYYAWNGTAWESIGLLTNNTASAAQVMTKGMTAAVFAAITPAQWKLLFTGANLGTFGIAYAMSINNAATDSATVNSATFNVNEVAPWKLQTAAEVEIRWYPTGVTFKTVAAGDYKLIYQTP